MMPRQITILMRGIATGMTPEITYVNRLATSKGAPITTISPEIITAARTCPTAAMRVQIDRSARNLKIYQTALTIAHQIAQQLTELEDQAADKGSPE